MSSAMLLTEITNEKGFSCIRGPFAINNFVLGTDVQTILEISLGEAVISAFMFLESLFPFPELVMPLDDCGKIWFEVTINLKNGLRIQRLC